MPRLFDIISQATAQLARAGVDNPPLDARLLIAHALHGDRMSLMMERERVLLDAEIASIHSLIDRRAKREPVARILGLREFWGLPFGLNEATLEPRPDSETLIESTLKLYPPISTNADQIPSPLRGGLGRGEFHKGDVDGCIMNAATEFLNSKAFTQSRPPLPSPPREGEGTPPALIPTHWSAHTILRILDLGTGTGCLLLALLHEWPEATGIGLDIAPRAVEQATENAKRLELEDRAWFQVGSWGDDIALVLKPYTNHERHAGLDPASSASLGEFASHTRADARSRMLDQVRHDEVERFDLVISNPPYIASHEISHLMPEVRDNDPMAALDGGVDGLDPYRAIIPQLSALLKPEGHVIFEVGYNQASVVREMLAQAGFVEIKVMRDLGGIERVISAQKTGIRDQNESVL